MTAHPNVFPDPHEVEVLISGAGPSGSALALDLTRRGVSVRIIDQADHAFDGSRAKGVQPRTQEVFDDFGIINHALAEGSQYPLAGFHLGPMVVPWRMQQQTRPSPDTPYPNALLLPQFRTDAMLHRALNSLGVTPNFGVTFLGYEQDDAGVTSTLSTGEIVRSRYLVGADGGASRVRKGADIGFSGTTRSDDRTIIVDADVEGLSRNRWHMWAKSPTRSVGACPLPHGEQFQIMMRLAPGETAELSGDALAARFRALTKYSLSNITWTSVFRPNVRLADRYRNGRVLIIGDAAHVHTPAGAQGLNTGVQDAYNLGWKLGQVLAGAPTSLLDTYEPERRPIAAAVLGRSSELYAGIDSSGLKRIRGFKRGDQERQLSLSYRGGPLAPSHLPSTATLHVGDRAPDAECSGNALASRSSEITRLFDAFRGPHFTLLIFGKRARASIEAATWPASGAPLRRFLVVDTPHVSDVPALVDAAGTLRTQYGIATDTIVLVRPDGYIAMIADENWASGLREAAERFA